MSMEGGGDSPKPKETLAETTKTVVESGFSGGRGLHGDAYTPWLVLARSEEDWDRITGSMDHYEEYVEKTAGTSAEADHIMQLSSPEAVAAFDQLVDEFNDDIDRMKKEKDREKLLEFVDKANGLIFKAS